MSVSVKMKPTSTICGRLGFSSHGPAQQFFTNECVKKMDKYIPKRDGNLRLIKDIQIDRVTYESPYAHAQYVGYTKGPVEHYTTPGTGPYWDKRMWSANKQSIIRAVQRKFGGK